MEIQVDKEPNYLKKSISEQILVPHTFNVELESIIDLESFDAKFESMAKFER